MTNTRTRQARPATAKTIPSLERHYPGADMNTAQLVNKLRHRGITDPRAAVRITSRDLMEDTYREAPQAQTPKMFDNNYSPYSNVNAEAVSETARREAEARRRAELERRRQNAAAPAKRQGSDMSRRRHGNTAAMEERQTSQTSQMSRPRPARTHAGGQLAESGPREVAMRRVPFPKFAFVIAFMFVVLFFMVQSIVKVYEYKRENAELKAQVEVLADRADLLKAELEQRIDYAEVEDWAEAIGMIKDSQVDQKYIDLSGGDIIENFGDENDDLGSFTTMLSAIRRRIAGLIGSGE